MSEISHRKAHHLELCATDHVAFRAKSTLFEEVDLLHDPFPELCIEELDTSCELLGKRLAAPIVIASMSGGTEEAVQFNRDLATVAEERQIAMGLGSMRPMIAGGEDTAGFFLRDRAPSILLLGNLGLMQARALSAAQIDGLLDQVGADALCLHLNPAQERIQPGGDRDFRGGIATLGRLSAELKRPIIAKETGCGIGRSAALRAREAGVRWLDLSGAGGTSWVGVEALRAEGVSQRLGRTFWDWGIPTAACLVQVEGLGMGAIATGGVATGLDVARAVALGAKAAGLARPFLHAHRVRGIEGIRELVDELVEGLRTAMLLTGCRDLSALRGCALALGPQLQAWIPEGSPLLSRVVNPRLRGV